MDSLYKLARSSSPMPQMMIPLPKLIGRYIFKSGVELAHRTCICTSISRSVRAAPAVVALAVVSGERVVEALAGAGVLLAALGRAGPAEVEGVGEDAQEANQTVQLPHAVLQIARPPPRINSQQTNSSAKNVTRHMQVALPTL